MSDPRLPMRCPRCDGDWIGATRFRRDRGGIVAVSCRGLATSAEVLLARVGIDIVAEPRYLVLRSGGGASVELLGEDEGRWVELAPAAELPPRRQYEEWESATASIPHSVRGVVPATVQAVPAFDGYHWLDTALLEVRADLATGLVFELRR